MPQLMLIDGERIPSATGEYFDVHDPATEELLDQAPMGNEEDARAAIAAANAAFRSWRTASAHERAALLRSLVVSPTERGARLGERLASDALRLARERGATDVYLLTETAERFFPRFGFSVADRSSAPPALKQSEEFRTACPESAVMMHVRFEAR